MNTLGTLHLDAGETYNAKLIFERVLNKNPIDKYALLNLGWISYWNNIRKINRYLDSNDPVKRSQSKKLIKTIVSYLKTGFDTNSLTTVRKRYMYVYIEVLTKLGKHQEA